jgi:hypothetical protein
VADELFDLDLLDEEDPFEIDAQAAHLFKHPRLGIEDIAKSGLPTLCSTPPNHRPTG